MNLNDNLNKNSCERIGEDRCSLPKLFAKKIRSTPQLT